MNLAELPKGISASISDVAIENDDTSLLEMGLLPGTKVALAYVSPLGDPIVVSLSDGEYQLSLRKEDACRVRIKTV
jgi:Fe2+ transport system protein FeoA